MLSVFEAGEASFRLADRHQQDIGWIRGSAIGFDGFAGEAEALAAALAGSAALDGFLQRLTGAARPAASAGARVKVTHDGAYEWVTRGAVPLARLYRPERDLPQRSRRRTFGVEFVLPSYVKEGAAISASQVLYNAIARPAASAPSARGGATASYGMASGSGGREAPPAA